jgi:hypothetical protein
MVDGIVELTDVRFGSRTERGLFVNKLRGSDYLAGRHPFGITPDGLVVHPRVEAAFRQSSQPDEARSGRLSTGVAGLDAMLGGGGLPEATVTGVLGPSGIGKTVLGLHFACGSGAAEPGLFFGFYETPSRLRQQAASLGLDLEGRSAGARSRSCGSPWARTPRTRWRTGCSTRSAPRRAAALPRRARRLHRGLGGARAHRPLLLRAGQRAAVARRDHALHHGDPGRGRPRHRAARQPGSRPSSRTSSRCATWSTTRGPAGSCPW